MLCSPVARCPECGSRVELQADPNENLVIRPVSAALLTLFLGCTFLLLCVGVYLADVRRIQDAWEIADREAAVETAIYKALSWQRSGADPATGKNVLFVPSVVTRAPIAKAAQRIATRNWILLALSGVVLVGFGHLIVAFLGYRMQPAPPAIWLRLKVEMLILISASVVLEVCWISVLVVNA